MADQCTQCRLDTAGDHEIHCPLHPDNQKARTDQRPPQPLLGWTCPACGGGLSPFTDRCPCVPLPAPVVTLNPPQPQVNITVAGFVGDETKLADEIRRVIRQDPVGHGFEVIGVGGEIVGGRQKSESQPQAQVLQEIDLGDRGFRLERDAQGKTVCHYREAPLPPLGTVRKESEPPPKVSGVEDRVRAVPLEEEEHDRT